MNHLPFVAGSYGLAAVVVLWLAVDARLRFRRARRRLRAVDPRGAAP